MFSRPLIAAACLLVTALSVPAAPNRDAAKLSAEFCASCHGPTLAGGSGPNLLDDVWLHGADDASITKAITEGYPQAGMPGMGAAFNAAEVRSLVVYLREQQTNYQRKRPTRDLPDPDAIFTSEQQRFRLETLAEGLDTPWSLAWLPDGRMLVTEKAGRLRIFDKNVLQPKAVSGIPEVDTGGQGGLLEVAVHPDYATNGWIYLAFSHRARNAAGEAVSMTKLVRGRLKGDTWADEQTIWTAPLETYRRAGGVHYGCRIAFDGKGYLYFSHGERGTMEHAQDVTRPNGKIHRIHDDGRIPSDNPFVGQKGAIGSIWTYGNRNPQGLTFQPGTGLLWETEHGPRGGDELNIIGRGKNYGWPIITYGMNYDGTAITEFTEKPGMEQPVIHWTPSIAVCGIDFYTGDRFPAWKGNLLVTALAQQELRRVVIEGQRVTHQEVLIKDLGRLRDVGTGPDGAIYVLFNDPGRVVRLVPVP